MATTGGFSIVPASSGLFETSLVLVDTLTSDRDTIVSFFSGIVGWEDTRVPNRIMPVPVTSGAGAAWSMSGDSLLVVLDSFNGVLQWYSLDHMAAELVREEDLGWPSIPIQGWFVEELEEWVATNLFQRRGLDPPKDFDFRAPPQMPNSGHLFFGEGGGVWIHRFPPDLLQLHRPVQASWVHISGEVGSEPVEFVFPEGFSLRAVGGGKYFGVAQAEFEVVVVRGLECR